MKSAKSTHCSWHPPNEAHGTTTAGAHPRKAGDEPGDSLLAAGAPTSMHHPKPSTAPSTSQGHKELAREDEDARGRSSSQGPQGRH